MRLQMGSFRWCERTSHPADFLMRHCAFSFKGIQANPEASRAFGAHYGYRDFSAAFHVDFAFVTEWADKLVFGHFSPP